MVRCGQVVNGLKIFSDRVLRVSLMRALVDLCRIAMLRIMMIRWVDQRSVSGVASSQDEQHEFKFPQKLAFTSNRGHQRRRGSQVLHLRLQKTCWLKRCGEEKVNTPDPPWTDI